MENFSGASHNLLVHGEFPRGHGLSSFHVLVLNNGRHIKSDQLTLNGPFSVSWPL